MSVKEQWDLMSPEERVCDGGLQYLAEEILESGWSELSKHTQNHLILLFLARKPVKRSKDEQ